MDKHPIKYGAPQRCPKCDGWNRSGRILPEECEWCGENKVDAFTRYRNKRLLDLHPDDQNDNPCNNE